jgi:hypothetical protein
METHMSKTFHCDSCSYTATHDIDLKGHKENEHHSKTLFTCKVCSEKFPSNDELGLHTKTHHTRNTADIAKNVNLKLMMKYPTISTW